MNDRTAPPPGAPALTPAHITTLLEAVIAVGRELHLETVLRRVVTSATELVGATYGAMGVLDARHQGLADFLHVGMSADVVDAIGALPEGRGLLGQLITDPRPLRVADLASHPAAAGFPPHHPPMTTFLGVPVRVRGDVFGNLYLTDKIGGQPFTEEDEKLAVALASVAGIAIENWRLHERVSELAVIEERERIARALHDTVIQRMFAIGLALDGVATQIDDPELASPLRRAAADLDETVDEIRETVLDPDGTHPTTRPVRRELTELIDEVADRLGVETSFHFEGDIDGTIGLDHHRDVADHLFASARDGVLALHTHRNARKTDLSVKVARDLTLTIRADGRSDPFDAAATASLVERAAQLGGHTVIGVDGPTTEIVWTVPLDPP